MKEQNLRHAWAQLFFCCFVFSMEMLGRFSPTTPSPARCIIIRMDDRRTILKASCHIMHGMHQGPHGESLEAGRLLGPRRNGRRHRPKPEVRVGRKPPQESALLEFEEEEMQTTFYHISISGPCINMLSACQTIASLLAVA